MQICRNVVPPATEGAAGPFSRSVSPSADSAAVGSGLVRSLVG